MFIYISEHIWKSLSQHLKYCCNLLITTVLVLFTINSFTYADEVPYLNKTLRFGMLPDSAQSFIDARFDPLIRYIRKETGIKIELVSARDYQDLLTQFKNKNIDLALFGGYTFIRAQQEVGAKPLVMRDIDLHFTTVFIAHSNNEKKSLEDFKDTTLSFGSVLSTSGHLMPRYFLLERNIDPEGFFSKVLYSGAHDKTAYWVRDGEVDLGAANSDVIEQLFKDGHLMRDDIQIIWETPIFTDYVWAVQSNMDEALQSRLMDSFLSLSSINPEHRNILNAMNTYGFLPANNADFNSLRKVIKLLEQEKK